MSLIIDKCREYHEGKITDDELVHWLTNDARYERQQACPYPKGSPEWYYWVEDRAPEPGTSDDLFSAHAKGLIEEEIYLRVMQVVEDRHQQRVAENLAAQEAAKTPREE
jgi:hypothetical protein